MEHKISRNELLGQIKQHKLSRIENIINAINNDPSTYKTERRVLDDIFYLILRAKIGLSESGKNYEIDCLLGRLWIEVEGIGKDVAENVKDYLSGMGYGVELHNHIETIMKDDLSCYLPWRWFMKKHKITRISQSFWIHWTNIRQRKMS